MHQKIVLSNKILPMLNKQGIVPKNEDGSYTTVFGAIGVDNSAGMHYTDSGVTRALFNPDSDLMRRVTQGLMKAEWGHPKHPPGVSSQVRNARARQIHEDRICGVITKLWLEDRTHHDGKTYTCIVGNIKPFGPFGQYLREGLEDGDINITFSGRYWSAANLVGNKYHLEIREIGTFDCVSEPGIAQSTKYNSPTLEDNCTLDKEVLIREAMMYNQSVKTGQMVTMESDAYIKLPELITALGIQDRTTSASDDVYEW